jgi:osmotically-inducible protein OsmY
MLDAARDSVACLPPTLLSGELPLRELDTASDRACLNADRALFNAVAQALRNTGHAALRDLDIEITGGVVVLWGRVPSYYQKQLAQEAVQQVHGAGRVANGLEVVYCRDRAPLNDQI